MADELNKQSPGTTDGTPQGTSPAGTSSASTPASKPVEPERTLVMGTDGIEKTMVMNPDMPDKTMVMDAEVDRTIVLSPENGISRVAPADHSMLNDTRIRIQSILHNPSSILSSLTGTGKRDVGEKIEKQDHHRARADVDRIEEEQAHLTDLQDRFEIERKLAEGARYVVSIGQDLGLERQVAVYSLRDEKLLDPAERANFVAEAEISAQLDHPSVLPIYSVNSDYRGGLHSAVKLTDGTDLRKYLNKLSSHYRSNGFRAAEEAASLAFRLELILGITDGLVYAHSRGVAHANLHPQNILIGEYHEVYIKGWGLARVLSGENAENADDGDKAKSKMPEISDPRFVAPELISGALPSIRSDVYALGMMLYELVTLHPPYPDASSPEVLELIRDGVSPTIEHRFGGVIDPDMRAIIQKAIAIDPEKRYGTVNELAEDIRRFLHSEEVSVRRISPSKRFAKLIRAHHREMFFFFLTLIVLVGALLAYNIVNDVRLANSSYLDDHVLGKAQASCRKTAHEFNLQAEKFNDMLSSIKFETEFLLSGHVEFKDDVTQYLVPPDDKAVTGSSGLQTEYSPGYGDSVSFRKIESGRAADLEKPDFVRLGMLQPTLFRYMLLAPLNAYVSKDTPDRQIHRLTQNVSPIYRIQILLNDGSSLHYPYTVKTEADLGKETVWYDRAVTSHKPQAFWNTPVPVENAADGAEHIVLPVSIQLGPADAPLGAAAILVSGRYIDQIMNSAENLPCGIEAQYFILTDGQIKVERINNGPNKPPTVNLEKGPYPDPWLMEWMKGKDFGAIIRREAGAKSPVIYCFAFVPAMQEWYVEKIRLYDFLHSIDPKKKGALK